MSGEGLSQKTEVVVDQKDGAIADRGQPESATASCIPVRSMSRSVALLFAAACGMAVASIYFAQPLLDSLAREFGLRHSSIGIVITVTQLCYGLTPVK